MLSFAPQVSALAREAKELQGKSNQNKEDGSAEGRGSIYTRLNNLQVEWNIFSIKKYIFQILNIFSTCLWNFLPE